VPEQIGQTRDSEELPLSAILLLERDGTETAFVWSLVHDVMRADLWVWHEDNLGHALLLLAFIRFRLILLDATCAPRLSLRTLIMRVQSAGRGTPIILRLPADDFPSNPDPRIYGVAAVVPKGIGGPTEHAIRRALGLA
jgi:hypothetical protein